MLGVKSLIAVSGGMACAYKMAVASICVRRTSPSPESASLRSLRARNSGGDAAAPRGRPFGKRERGSLPPVLRYAICVKSTAGCAPRRRRCVNDHLIFDLSTRRCNFRARRNSWAFNSRITERNYRLIFSRVIL